MATKIVQDRCKGIKVVSWNSRTWILVCVDPMIVAWALGVNGALAMVNLSPKFALCKDPRDVRPLWIRVHVEAHLTLPQLVL